MDIKDLVSQGFILGQQEIKKLNAEVMAFILSNINKLEKMSIKELKKLLVGIQDEHKAEQEIIMIIKKLIENKKGISNA